MTTAPVLAVQTMTPPSKYCLTPPEKVISSVIGYPSLPFCASVFNHAARIAPSETNAPFAGDQTMLPFSKEWEAPPLPSLSFPSLVQQGIQESWCSRTSALWLR